MDIMYWLEWTGQNGLDRMDWIEWTGQNGLVRTVLDRTDWLEWIYRWNGSGQNGCGYNRLVLVRMDWGDGGGSPNQCSLVP